MTNDPLIPDKVPVSESVKDFPLPQTIAPKKIRKRASPFTPEKPAKKIKSEYSKHELTDKKEENSNGPSERKVEKVDMEHLQGLVRKMSRSFEKAHIGLKMLTKHLGEIYAYIGEVKKVVGE